MIVRLGEVYMRISGDRRKYWVRAISEIADLVVLEAADWTKIMSTFRDFETSFMKERL